MQKQSYEIIVLDLDGTLTNREKNHHAQDEGGDYGGAEAGERGSF